MHEATGRDRAEPPGFWVPARAVVVGSPRRARDMARTRSSSGGKVDGGHPFLVQARRCRMRFPCAGSPLRALAGGTMVSDSGISGQAPWTRLSVSPVRPRWPIASDHQDRRACGERASRLTPCLLISMSVGRTSQAISPRFDQYSRCWFPSDDARAATALASIASLSMWLRRPRKVALWLRGRRASLGHGEHATNDACQFGAVTVLDFSLGSIRRTALEVPDLRLSGFDVPLRNVLG
jgi:hypothetical protein